MAPKAGKMAPPGHPKMCSTQYLSVISWKISPPVLPMNKWSKLCSWTEEGRLAGVLGRVGKMGADVGFPNESKSSVVDMGKARKTYVLGAGCAFSGLE